MHMQKSNTKQGCLFIWTENKQTQTLFRSNCNLYTDITAFISISLSSDEFSEAVVLLMDFNLVSVSCNISLQLLRLGNRFNCASFA